MSSSSPPSSMLQQSLLHGAVASAPPSLLSPLSSHAAAASSSSSYHPPSSRPIAAKSLLVVRSPTAVAGGVAGASPARPSSPYALSSSLPSAGLQLHKPRASSAASLGVTSVPASSTLFRFAPTPPPSTFEELRAAQGTSVVPGQATVVRVPLTVAAGVSRATRVSIAAGADSSDDDDSSFVLVRPPLQPTSVALSSITRSTVPNPKTELKSLWKLAYPVGLALLFRIGMSVTDVSVLGHAHTNWLAGAAAAFVWLNISSAFLYRSFGSSLNTLCAQAYGAGNFELVGLWLQQGLLFGTIASVVVGASWWGTSYVLAGVGVEQEVADLAGTFAKWSTLWLLPQVWQDLLSRYFQAQGVVWPSLVINGCFVPINLALNLLLVFGLPSGWVPSGLSQSVHDEGWAGVGFIGSPIATAVCRWMMLIIYVAWTVVYKKLHAKTFLGWNFSRGEHGALHPRRVRQYLLLQCLPAAIGVCLEEWQLEIVALMATRLGSVQIATHNATLELFFFLTAAMFGLVTATQIRIGSFLGSGNAMAARQVAHIGLKISLVLGAIVGVLFVVLRAYIGRIYSDDPAIWSLAEKISVLVGAAYTLLAFFYASMAVLDGQGRPLVVAVGFLVGSWVVALPLSWVFAYHMDLGLMGLWYALCLGYAVVTIIVGWKSATSDWDECVREARERAEMKKNAPDDDEPTNGKRKRKSRKRRSHVSSTARSVPSESALGSGDSINKTQLTVDGTDSDDGGSESAVSSSDEEEAWNAEEIRYRNSITESSNTSTLLHGVRPVRSQSVPHALTPRAAAAAASSYVAAPLPPQELSQSEPDAMLAVAQPLADLAATVLHIHEVPQTALQPAGDADEGNA